MVRAGHRLHRHHAAAVRGAVMNTNLPRPWVVDETDPSFWQVRAANGHVFAKALEYPEDARLIAAAPELLAALKTARDFLERDYLRTNIAAQKALRNVNAAIDKATGEQQ